MRGSNLKFFDLHADIGYDVFLKHQQGIHDVVRDIHMPKFRKGSLNAICMASYFEGNESWEVMQKMIETLHDDLLSCDQIKIIRSSADLINQDDKLKVIFSVEGMCGIQDDVEAKISWLYDHDVRLASLTWNEENKLANGVLGCSDRGLSELGVIAIKKMEELGIIIDVSHANEKTFWDIMKYSQGVIIASHSNVYNLCVHPRNLKDEQIKAIADRGGIIGLNGYRKFVNQERGDIDQYVEHALYLKDLIGIEHIALGVDFMDILPGDPGMTYGLESVCQLPNLYEVMKRHNLNEEEIQKICFENAEQLFRKNLK